LFNLFNHYPPLGTYNSKTTTIIVLYHHSREKSSKTSAVQDIFSAAALTAHPIHAKK
jgi:hypothetical protein